ncbi:MAG: C39 family peptidase [Patescibacteria group bacterium]
MSLLLLWAILFSFASTVSASTLDDLIKQQKLNASIAESARKQREQKEKDAALVKNQIEYVSDKIDEAADAIESTQGQISSTEETIDELTDKIRAEEDNLAKENDRLKGVVSSWYMEGEDGFLISMISSDNLSQMVTQQQYYDSIRQQIDISMNKIQQLKDELQKQKGETTGQYMVLQGLKNNQLSQKNNLELQKRIKDRLLNDTKAMVSELSVEEEQARARVAELQSKIDQIKAASVGTGGDVISTSAEGWYLKQVDDRWSDYKMGNYATIGLYGCLITSLAMIANYYGSNYTPVTAVQNSSFVRGGRSDGALIQTSIVSDGGSVPIDWAKVDTELAASHPVVVGVAMGVDMGNTYGVSHFVVLKSKMSDGRYAMQDPLGEGRGYRKSQIKAMRVVRP